MNKVNIPYDYKSLDFNELVRSFPPPAEFEQTLFRWDRDKIRETQAEKFRKIIEVAWNNPFYKRKWTEAGLEPKDIRGIKDIPNISIMTVYDFKAAIDAYPPFGDHQGITPAGAKEKPLKIQSSRRTTGKPRPTFYGPLEWEINGISSARALFIQGSRPVTSCRYRELTPLRTLHGVSTTVAMPG